MDPSIYMHTTSNTIFSERLDNLQYELTTFKNVKSGHLKTLGPVYFIDDNLTIIKKYFDILNKKKNIIICKTETMSTTELFLVNKGDKTV